MKRLDLTERQFKYFDDLIENCMTDTYLGARWRELQHSNTELWELAEIRRKIYNLKNPVSDP